MYKYGIVNNEALLQLDAAIAPHELLEYKVSDLGICIVFVGRYGSNVLLHSMGPSPGPPQSLLVSPP